MHKVLLKDNITVTVRKHRQAKKLKLSIRADGKVNLTIPYFLPYFTAKAFIQQKKDWIIDKLAGIDSKNISRKGFSDSEIKQHKKNAQEIIQPLVDRYALIYNVRYRKIFIKNQRSVWGSCSVKQNLNFNWRIILTPPEIIRYLVVHEICHLLEMNHSRKFWDLVALAIPDYKECRKWLRKDGRKLY